jgi:hypothetical protein
MHGELTATSTADVCRDLATSGSTGVLEVVHPRGDGQIVFERGRVVSASSPAPGARLGDRLVNAGIVDEDALAEVLRGQAERSPGDRPRLGRLLVDAGLVTPDAVRLVVQEQVIDAVFELTTWAGARFEFAPTSPFDSPEVPLSVAVDQLLVEVARRRSEWDTLSQVIPDLGAVPRFREGANPSSASLEPDEFAVLASVDGHRSVRELAEDLGYGEFEAARVIYALVLLGQVEVIRPVDEIGAAFDEALHADPGDDLASFGLEVPGTPPPDAPLDSDDIIDRWAVEHEGTIFPAPPEPTDEPEAAEPDQDDPAEGFAAFAELRDFSSGADQTDDVGPPPAGEPASDPATASETAAATEGPTGGEVAAGDEGAAGAETSRPQAPRPRHGAAPSGDVSEFLRELSRLALDEETEEPSPPGRSSAAPRAGGDGSGGDQPAPPPRREPPGRNEAKRKRRLFGRGG